MSKAEVILTLGCHRPFTDEEIQGILVQVIGAKYVVQDRIFSDTFEQNVFIPSQGMHRKPPFPSTSLGLDDAINFFEGCIEACKKVKNDIGVE